MNPLFAAIKGTAMKDKKKRSGGGAPPTPGTYPESTDNGLGVQDNVFGVAGLEYFSQQTGMNMASVELLDIRDFNTGATVAPFTGSNPLMVADYLATITHSQTPAFPSLGLGETILNGEVTLNIANNGSDTGIDVGVSLYDTTNQRFPPAPQAQRASLNVFVDALGLIPSGVVNMAGGNMNTIFPGTPFEVGARLVGGAIVLTNPPPIASGELVFEVSWDTITSKRGGGDHSTDRASSLSDPFTGNAYFGVVVT